MPWIAQAAYHMRGLMLSILIANCLGCSTTKEIRAQINDTDGRPLPGAILYAEAFIPNEGAYDFAFAVADSNGEVGRGRTALNLKWRMDARLALAVFAPGKKPIAIIEELQPIATDSLAFMLQALSSAPLQWEPRLALLSFPFEKQPALHANLAAPEFAPLIAAFRDAYGPIARREISVLPNEQAKLDALMQCQSPP